MYAIPVVVAIVDGIENHIKPARMKPHTPWIGLAAILLCHDAWSQYVTAEDTNTSMTPYRNAPPDLNVK
jgi:hypothetical protein